MLYYSSPKCTGVMIGVLMEEEVPLGLEIIGKCVEQNSKLISLKYSVMIQSNIYYSLLITLFILLSSIYYSLLYITLL